MEAKKAVFIDKDGTLIPDIPYNVNPALIELSENSLEGLRKLHDLGFKIIVITNQSGISRGYFTVEDLKKVELRIGELLAAEGIPLTGFYFCPHHPDGSTSPYNTDCSCRKPQPGLILKAASEHAIDLTQSWMIGDILNDIEAGKSAGTKAILIDNGNETEWIQNDARRMPDFKASNLNEAAEFIIKIGELVS